MVANTINLPGLYTFREKRQTEGSTFVGERRSLEQLSEDVVGQQRGIL